nr:immunoglobulin light chain junction region [Mus musculus]
CFQGSGYPLTF